jgi:CRP/FNR family transcriptional regulator, cyclic AMP receptor protein
LGICRVSCIATLDREVLLEIIEMLNGMRSSVREWFSDFLGMSLRKRLETVLLDLGTRFGARETNAILLIPELSHVDLAEMIGSSRPMVSRLLAEMMKEGLVEKRGQQFALIGRFTSAAMSAPDGRKNFG